MERPIFIIGVGRSGSSIFHRMFSEHPGVAWLSSLCDRYPAKPSRNRALMKAIDAPIIGSILKRRFEPEECYDFWNHYFHGFGRPCRDLVAADVTEVARGRVRRAMSGLVTQARHRLLLKVTGWPRIGFLREIFPDAKFIHIYRDGRAVVNSLLEVDFWWGWRGPQNWRHGELSPAQRQEWEKYGKSFVALAAIELKILMEATETAKLALAPDALLEVRYEDFAANPVQAYKEATQFCDLEWSDGFERSLSGYSVKTANDKWKKDLTTDQQAILEAVLAPSLSRYRYR